MGCKGLEDVTLPDSVVRVGCYVFALGSHQLRVSVPASVSDVDARFAELDAIGTEYAVLRGEKGSAVARYAVEKGIEFHEMQFPA